MYWCNEVIWPSQTLCTNHWEKIFGLSFQACSISSPNMMICWFSVKLHPLSSFRLNGCYEALEGGNTAEALIDFTGGVSEPLSLDRETLNLHSNQRKELFHSLAKVHERKALITCSIRVELFLLIQKILKPSQFDWVLLSTSVSLLMGRLWSPCWTVGSCEDMPTGWQRWGRSGWRHARCPGSLWCGWGTRGELRIGRVPGVRGEGAPNPFFPSGERFVGTRGLKPQLMFNCVSTVYNFFYNATATFLANFRCFTTAKDLFYEETSAVQIMKVWEPLKMDKPVQWRSPEVETYFLCSKLCCLSPPAGQSSGSVWLVQRGTKWGS